MKAAVWGTLAGAAQIAVAVLGTHDATYIVLTAAGYGLILPVIAILHHRHARVRQSGATLATISGTAVVTVGIAASANGELLVAALFLRGLWWWTVGKLWWETGVLHRPLGALTMALAAACLVLVFASVPLGVDMALASIPLRLALGVWLVAVSADLLRVTM